MKQISFSFLIFFLLLNTIKAQTSINIGDNINGQLDFIGDVENYKFCSGAGEKIYIRSTSTAINFLKLELFDPLGNLVEDTFSNLVAEINALTTISGEYTLLVKSQNGDEAGSFSISFQRTINPINGTPLSCNSATMNSLDFVTKAKPFVFSVTSATDVNLTLSSNEITFIRMELYNPSGERIAEVFSNLTAQIQMTLIEEGCYVLMVMSQWGDETGSFSLAQNITMGQCTSVCPINEVCFNGMDDDGDGLIDCQDEDCCNFYDLPTAFITGDLEFCEEENSILTASGGDTYNWSTGEDTPSIIIDSVGEYTVTISINNGCTDTESVFVIVHDKPIANISGELEFCENESSTLEASGGSEYFWNTGETTEEIEVDTSGIYFVIVHSEEGCADTSLVEVEVFELPNAIISGNLGFCFGGFSTIMATGGTSFEWSNGFDVPNINVSNGGDYTVTVTDENNCTDVASVEVIEYPLPNVSIDGDTEFCIGETTTLIANGGISYNWNTGDTTAFILVDQPNTYVVTVTDINGCTNTDLITTIQNMLPEVSLSLLMDSICVNESAFPLNGGLPVGGSYTGTGVNGLSYDPQIAGIGIHLITYSFTDLEGCTNTVSNEIIVNEACTNNLEQVLFERSIQVYPNPSTGKIYIQLYQNNNQITFKLFNAQGQIILLENQSPLQIDNLSPGIYMLQISDGEFSAVRRLIVN